MTQPPQWGPPPPQWGPPPPHRSPSQRKVWLVVAGVGVLIAVIVVVVVLSVTRSGSSNQSSSSNPSSSTPGGVTGTQDEWMASVCRAGSFRDGQGLPDASSGSGICHATTGDGWILMGKYDSDFKMRNALAQRGIKNYASEIDSDGTEMVFAAYQGGASVLEPLTEFGFTINTAPTG